MTTGYNYTDIFFFYVNCLNTDIKEKKTKILTQQLYATYLPLDLQKLTKNVVCSYSPLQTNEYIYFAKIRSVY